MAKFRTNHSTSNSKSSGVRGSASSKTTLIRSVFFFIAICVIIYLLTGVKSTSWDSSQPSIANDNVVLSGEEGVNVESNFLPESTTGQVIHHTHYTLSYSEEHEQAEWVAYKLTKENLDKPRVKRVKKYTPDPSIPTLSAKHNDYSHSGYTRGHLVPAGDMNFSKKAMRETFFMSNISPQTKEFNGGIWRELEENVRNWARKEKELYIIAGPLLQEKNIIKEIGYNQVAVPDAFYKIILDLTGAEKKSIAFIIPNKKSETHLSKYVVTIDEIEELTGVDFFADFLSEELEEDLEKSIQPELWQFDQKKYNLRVKSWNNY
ncbi:MAG: DNA/RNA non-specific endonuclease [Saprospiraceae bacterium]|nr:DNA/RNA non-specific endonuclease [Saprospiraceae bacterium]